MLACRRCVTAIQGFYGDTSGMKRKILLIEDEAPIADTIVYALESEGFTVAWCPTGQKGLDVFDPDQVCLVILDIGLPDISGFDVARQIRGLAMTPLIFLTARSEEVDRIVGLEMGADDYVVKPFSPRELTARVRAVLRRTEQGTEEPSASAEGLDEVIPERGFFIHTLRHQIYFDGEPLDLSRYEFRLLEILVRRPGQVFSREHLMNLAWETPEMSMERTVDTHIKTIRKKLKAARPQEDVIITHRGVGYSLRDDL